MKKGYHTEKWFVDQVGNFIYNTKTQTSFFIEDIKHAKQIYLYQNLNNQTYIKTNN
jgi:hypothetical protein